MNEKTGTPAGESMDFDKRMTAQDPLYPARSAALTALHKHIDQWFANYEFDDGEHFTHSPNELERLLIADAFYGLTADEDYCRLESAWRALCPAADRDSWHQQHSDRLDDALKFAKEADEAKVEIARLTAERDGLKQAIGAYEKHGVTCQTYRHFVDAPCAECNAIAKESGK